MTTDVDICNRALLNIGLQKTISSLSQDSIEAKACNSMYANTRDGLLRMAPWNCGMKTRNLTYITSAPGTPENTSAATNLWQVGQPRPPWAYEYQYPVDCLRACWIIPASQSGFTGVPITTAVTGGAASTWLGGPIVFKVAIDEFLMATSVFPVTPGSGYAVEDLITLALVPATSTVTNKLGSFSANAPQGAAVQIAVASVDGAGGILTCTVLSQLPETSSPPAGGSYFYHYATPPIQASTSGSGTGATFGANIVTSAIYKQRVILTNQEYATLVYVAQVSNPNIWDVMFQDAMQDTLAANLVMVLTGDKGLANTFIHKANETIADARKADGNEGLTINDVTPDWIRVRGYGYDIANLTGPYSSFDWGSFLPSYG